LGSNFNMQQPSKSERKMQTPGFVNSAELFGSEKVPARPSKPSKRPKNEVPSLMPNLIDGNFLDKQDEPVKTPVKKAKKEMPNLLPNLIDGDFLDVQDKQEEPKKVPVKKAKKETPNLLPNLIDGDFLDEQKEPEKTASKTEKKETKEKASQTDEEKSFICSDCEAEFNRKFKHNRHIYVAHKKMSDQLEEIIKTAEKHGRDLAENSNDCHHRCYYPIIMIYID